MSQTTDKRIRLKPHLSVIGHSADIVEIRSGAWNASSYTVTDDKRTGKLYTIISGLDGSRSPSELAEAADVSESTVYAVIDRLQNLGLVQSRPSSALSFYLEELNPVVWAVRDQGAQCSKLVLVGDDDLLNDLEMQLADGIPGCSLSRLSTMGMREIIESNDDSWLADALKRSEVFSRFEEWQGQFLIAVSSVVNPIRYKVINRIALAHKVPWLHAVMDGPFLLIGPTMVPARGACYECLEQRVLMNLRQDASYMRYKQALVEGHINRRTPPLLKALSRLLTCHTALEAINFCSIGTTFTFNKCLAIYLPTFEFSFNDILRVPGCPACGPTAARDDRELYFELSALLKSV